MNGANIEIYGPNVDKSKNGYVKGWTRKVCLKPIHAEGIVIKPTSRYFVHRYHFGDKTRFVEARGKRIMINGKHEAPVFDYQCLLQALKDGTYIEVTKDAAMETLKIKGYHDKYRKT